MDKFIPFYKWVLFLVFATCFVLYHQYAYLGHYGFDDLQYAELATKLLKGNWDWADHFGYRWAVVGLTALSYMFFGINDLGSAMPALVLSISTLLLIFLILKKYKIQVLFFGLALFSFNNWTLFYADKLMPDAYVAFFVFAAFVAYYLFLQNKRGKTLNYSLWFVLALFLAFLSKGTVVLALPLFLILFVSDLVQKKNKKFWMYSLGIGAGLGLSYFIFLFAATGDPFIRFKAIEGGSYLNFCSYNEQPLRVLLKRVVYGLFYELSHQGMLVGFLLTLPVLLFIKPNAYLKQQGTVYLFSVSAIILLLLANFMSISFKGYSPMCTHPRHYLYLIPFFAVAAPLALDSLGNKWKYLLSVLALVTITTLLLYYFENMGMFKILAAFAGCAILFFLLGKRLKIVNGLVFFILGMVLILKPVEAVKYANEVDYTAQKWFYQRNIVRSDVDVVVSDEVSKRYLNYFAGFNAKGKQFLSFQEAEEKGLPENASAYLLKNSYTNYLSGAKGASLPFFVQYPEMVYDTFLVSRTQDIVLYDVERWVKPKSYLQSKNGMEKEMEFWTFDKWALDVEHALEGKYSNRAKEFSSTFTMDLSRIDTIQTEMAIVEANVFANVPDETTASMVISIDNKEGTVFWEAFSIQPMLKSYGGWWPVQVNKMLPKENLAPGNTLKVYVWNKELEPVYLDNFEVKISGL